MDMESPIIEMAKYIIGTADESLPRIHQLVDRDRQATGLNLTLAYAWSVCRELGAMGSGRLAENASNAIVKAIAPTLSIRYDIPEDSIRSIAHDRFTGYDAATESTSGEPPLNVAHYFMGCCTDMRPHISYDNVVPDPNDLSSTFSEEELDQDSLRKLHQAVQDDRVVTYPLNLLFESLEISSCIMGFGSTLIEQMSQE